MDYFLIFLNEILFKITQFLTSLKNNLGINALDFVIFFILGFYAYEGYLLGFFISGLDLVSFIFSFIIALKFYQSIGLFLGDVFSISPGFARAAGFFVLALISEVFFGFILRKLAKRIPDSLYNPSTSI